MDQNYSLTKSRNLCYKKYIYLVIYFLKERLLYEVGENKKQERESVRTFIFVLRLKKVANGHVLLLDLFAPPSKDGGKV